jgi:ribosome-associated protein
MTEFDLEGRDYIELHSLLKVTGLCESGGVAKLLIADGQVKVDGEVELRKRCKIRTGQTVEYDRLRLIVQ